MSEEPKNLQITEEGLEAEPAKPVNPIHQPILISEIEDQSDEMRRVSRKSFLWAFGALTAVYGGWRLLNGGPEQVKGRWVWTNAQPQIDGQEAPFRKGFEYNEKVWEAAFNNKRLVRTYKDSERTDSRQNGDEGLGDDFDPSDWKLTVKGVHGQKKPVTLSMEEIKAMPSITMTTEFFCIEGWSIIQTWKGVPMAEFCKRYPPATRSGARPDLEGNPMDLMPYVSMVTPDEGYYVGLDMPSVLHPQTMLCYEMNGKPLELDHGAPLRLVIPVKYGIKNIKRIGVISFQTERPKDFWAEQGYDWYSGL